MQEETKPTEQTASQVGEQQRLEQVAQEQQHFTGEEPEEKKPMSTYQLLGAIRHLLLKRMMEGMIYEWSNEYRIEHFDNSISIVKDSWSKSYPDLNNLDISTMTKKEMTLLGFKTWSEELPIMLIPVWIFPFLPEKVNVTCIDGRIETEKSKMDNDNRLGMLPYGVMPKDNVLSEDGNINKELRPNKDK